MTAAKDANGRTCPYCRSTIEERERVTECPACNATHHADCWAENGGCAVPLCEGGPKEGATPAEATVPPAEVEAPTQVVAVDPPPPPPPTPSPAQPLPSATPAPPVASPPRPPLAGKAAPQPRGPAPRRGGIGFLPVLVGVIILLGGGTAAAIILTQKHHSGNSSTTADTETASASASSSAAEENSEPFEAETTAETEPVYQPSPPEQVEEALQAHFGRLVADNYTAAYADLTPAEGEAIGGEEAWVAAQSGDGLKHFELTVEVSMHGPHAATAEIVYFATHAYESGCHTWTGSWEMVKQYGSWLISAADLERGSC